MTIVLIDSWIEIGGHCPRAMFCEKKESAYSYTVRSQRDLPLCIAQDRRTTEFVHEVTSCSQQSCLTMRR